MEGGRPPIFFCIRYNRKVLANKAMQVKVPKKMRSKVCNTTDNAIKEQAVYGVSNLIVAKKKNLSVELIKHLIGRK